MHVAAAGGHVDIIKMLVHGQGNVFARDSSSRTPLHLAAKHGRVEAVKYLMLQTKAEAEEKDRKWKRKFVDEFEEKEVDAADPDWVTYLDDAILNGQRYIVLYME